MSVRSLLSSLIDETQQGSVGFVGVDSCNGMEYSIFRVSFGNWIAK